MNATDTQTINRFFEAIQGDDTATLEALLASDPALLETQSPGGLQPVMAATYSGADAALQVLIAHGAELDIFAAAALGATDRLRDLLQSQPQLASAYSADGWTALHLAGHFGRADSAAILLDRGADLAAISHNRNANTALHAALAGRQEETVRLLIERGADITVTDAGGYTPLHLAAHEGNVALVQMLLTAGADPRARTAHGKTPRDMAEEEGNTQVADLLPG